MFLVNECGGTGNSVMEKIDELEPGMDILSSETFFWLY